MEHSLTSNYLEPNTVRLLARHKKYRYKPYNILNIHKQEEVNRIDIRYKSFPRPHIKDIRCYYGNNLFYLIIGLGAYKKYAPLRIQ